MGTCKCASGKHCGIHFFKKVEDVKVYEEKKHNFESKYSKKKGDRTPEFEVEDV